MKKKTSKRVTIYDIAKKAGIAPSTVSKALNDKPNVSEKVKALVKATAEEFNYVHNTNAANLRKGLSKTIGVIVPKINTFFFSEVIAGMEEVCSEHRHNMIVCQSDESAEKEKEAVGILMHQNVDCIFISLSAETKTCTHLEDVIAHNVNLIQFDRVDDSIPSYCIVNDNKDAAYKAVKHLIGKGYVNIALLGGPGQLPIYRDRKEGYIQAAREADLMIPYNFVTENVITTDEGMQTALELLNSKTPPDAFFAVSDYGALGALKAAISLGLSVPEQIGIVGFSDETFTRHIDPAISTVDQKSRQLGIEAMNIYFDHILERPHGKKFKKIIKSTLIIRNSSRGKKL